MAHLSADLLKILRCPVTGSALERRGDELVSTRTDDDGERVVYPVRDGIPVLLPPTAA
ncbi:Trm112 family protein [Zhihengliuella halotolerans]|uniref:Uncharacterized protein n=1 Tax=Zhihengliuella halotolerans TaxID=370736 RepID=A0A4Q8AEK7_9MICC|nr:Trm112 family protein [Zhihengliuella halotolerans]RZU62083.1 hypothetical protein EV380_1671 [Zhihengliuella halotolerans]